MSGWKRAPSSLVKAMTAMSRFGVSPASRSAASTSTPAITPSAPSKRPPVPTVSICEPMTTAGPSSSPLRMPTMLPIASMRTARPSA